MSERFSLRTLDSRSELVTRLASAGLSPAASGMKALMFTACAKALSNSGLDDRTAVRAFFVPGRIEVLGKHTDYAGGRSIVTAAEKGFCIVAVPRQDTTVRIVDAGSGEYAEFRISDRLQPNMGHWCNYPMTVARRLARNFSGRLCGAEVAFTSDLPRSAGMSSSSAMMVGFFLVLSACNDLAARKEYDANIRGREDLSTYLSAVENGRTFRTFAGDKGVGTLGGSEDHTAIVCCRSGMLSQYSYCPVRLERTVKFPSSYVLAVASSGVVAEKTGAAMEKYNRLSKLTRCIVELWNEAAGRADPHLAAAIASSPDAPDRLRSVLRNSDCDQFSSDELLKRFRHFLAESEKIVPAAGDALASGDFGQFGRQVIDSQQLAEELLDSQIPQTSFLVRCALDLGAAASSAFGAGFGGSVWALTKAANAEELIRQLSVVYRKKFPKAATNSTFLLTCPGPAAFEL